MGFTAGQLRRHRVTIQTRSTAPNTVGQRIPTWGSPEERWAEVEDLSGRTFLVGMAASSRARTQVTLRLPVTLAPLTHRIVFGSRVLCPVHLERDPDGVFVRVLCEEDVGNGGG